MSRYPNSRKVVFDNIYELKIDFINFLKGFSINIICIKFKNLQVNDPVESLHQVIYDMPVNKDLNNKIFDYIYMGQYTLIYIMVKKGLLTPHYKVKIRIICLWYIHDIQRHVNLLLAGYNHKKVVAIKHR